MTPDSPRFDPFGPAPESPAEAFAFLAVILALAVALIIASVLS